MNLKEARRAAQAAGITDPTPEDLRQFGWAPRDYLAGYTPPAQAYTEQQVRDQVSALVEEAKAANLSAVVVNAIVKLGGIALGAI